MTTPFDGNARPFANRRSSSGVMIDWHASRTARSQRCQQISSRFSSRHLFATMSRAIWSLVAARFSPPLSCTLAASSSEAIETGRPCCTQAVRRSFKLICGVRINRQGGALRGQLLPNATWHAALQQSPVRHFLSRRSFPIPPEADCHEMQDPSQPCLEEAGHQCPATGSSRWHPCRDVRRGGGGHG